MGWGDSKRDVLIAENAALKRENELLKETIASLKEDKVELLNQVRTTQEALVAKESPEAYRDLLAARADADKQELTEEEKAERVRQREEARVATAYINELENPLFRNAEDLQSILMRGASTPGVEMPSVHGNNES